MPLANATTDWITGGTVTHFEFVDSLGNAYSAPIPGIKATRRNWRLQKRYVPK